MIDHSSISWRPYPRLNTSSPEIKISRPRTTAECRLFQPLSLPACSHIASGILSCSQCEATCAVASISAGSEVFSVHSDYRNWVNRRESSEGPVWRSVPAGCRHNRRGPPSKSKPRTICEHTREQSRSRTSTRLVDKENLHHIEQNPTADRRTGHRLCTSARVSVRP